jgi:hypothetical protein
MVPIILALGLSNLYAQGRPYEGPDDPAGDVAATRKGWMDGNRVYMPFFNNTQLGDFSLDCVGWPNDAKRIRMHDDIGLLIGARVFVEQDSIPVTDPAAIAARTGLDTLFFIQTHYRGDTKKNTEGTVEWGFYPVFGYFNELSEYPAMSNRSESWPTQGWPSRGNEKKWRGEWNGRFGRGVQYADLETYFVANDAQDQHYLVKDQKEKYYPRPGIKIGYKDPNVTIQKGMPWGGLGLRVEVRAFQWNNPQARDAVFIEYTIANISDYDLNDMAFSYYVDTGVGGDDPDGDWGYFSRELNMTYAWDYDGVGLGGLQPGIMGLAFLESPGVIDDNKDNDDDGLTDERRDNTPHVFIDSPAKDPFVRNVAQDTAKFRYYNKRQWQPHWDADEDGDWRDGNDVNGNGVYDPDESPGDDVGTDGVGPGELNYSGPDANGTECNHRPDFIEGLGSEPNFGATDIGESDMLGLTMFKMYEFTLTGYLFRSDRRFYDFITTSGLNEYTGGVTNLAQTFASSRFRLFKGTTERISLANLYSYEDLNGLNTSAHSAPALYQKKRIVQAIYDADYRFLQPPMLPTLTATPGDGKVYLTWNDVSDKLTRQPFLNGKNDFEGYKLYKATDKYFSDAEQLRDMYGNPAGKKPILQCDLKNNIKGASENGVINGEPFYLGDDTGIQHFFVDNNVQNGRTYYYALVAYNYGVAKSGKDGVSIAPAENNTVIDLDEAEEIRYIGRNVQIAVPHQAAAGYQSPYITFEDKSNGIIAGNLVAPNVYDFKSIKAGHTYKVKFQTGSMGYLRTVPRTRHRSDGLFSPNGYVVYDITDGHKPVAQETPQKYLADNLVDGYFNVDQGLTSDVFDGIQLFIKPALKLAEYDPVNSGWLRGTSPIDVNVSSEESRYFTWDYSIIFSGIDTAYTSRTNLASGIADLDGFAIGNAALLLGKKFNFYVINKMFKDNSGDYEKLDVVVYDKNMNKTFDPDSELVLVGPAVQDGRFWRWGGTVFGISFARARQQMPKPDDVFRVTFRRPLSEKDSLLFKVHAAAENPAQQRADLKKIKVVPNPYVMTNMMEPALMNKSLNQRRRLLFTHVPASCTITIFTSSGVLVDDIKVENPQDDGTAHWDMLTKEGLEIASGVYFYHVQIAKSRDEAMGKFAVIK